MNTPKDTWISVKDAMPPMENEYNGDYFQLVGITNYNNLFKVFYLDDKIIIDSDAADWDEFIIFWMLLSKPKTTN